MRIVRSCLILMLAVAGCGPAGDPALNDDVTDVKAADTIETAVGDTATDNGDDIRIVDGFDTSGTDADGDSSEPVCVSSTPCAYDSDCPQGTGNRCNTALEPPKCQLLYCGQIGSPCSDALQCEQMTCTDNVCVQKPCEPNCQDLECGVDSECLMDVCGTCGEGYKCESGACVIEVCEPDCSSRECGTEPVCGTSCGACDEGFICQSGNCIEDPCVPDCTGLECGKDPVCGKSCGSCGTGFVCDWGSCADEDACLGDNGGSCKVVWTCVQGCGDTSTTEGATCRTACLSKTSPEGLTALTNYEECVEGRCGDITNAADKAACIGSWCMEQEIDCLWGCTYETCAEMLDCRAEFPNSNLERVTTCDRNSTPVAQKDDLNDRNCFYENCPICTYAHTEAELGQCKYCTDEASIGACWDGWAAGTCSRFGTTYTTCAGLQSCFENCDLTTSTQTDYDNCRTDCTTLATSDVVRNLGLADLCTRAECAICATDYASNGCKTCRATTAAEGGACFTDWFICAQTTRIGCYKLANCTSGCDTGKCADRCYDIGTQAAQTKYNAIFECFNNECNDVPISDWGACIDATCAPGGACEAIYNACINDLS